MKRMAEARPRIGFFCHMCYHYEFVLPKWQARVDWNRPLCLTSTASRMGSALFREYSLRRTDGQL